MGYFFAVHNPASLSCFGRKDTMTNAMAALGIAVGCTSLICYALMTRLQNRQRKRRCSGDNAIDGSGDHGGEGGWSIASWFGGDHSASDSSGNPIDSGGGDSGGGGDGGSGGGGD